MKFRESDLPKIAHLQREALSSPACAFLPLKPMISPKLTLGETKLQSLDILRGRVFAAVKL